MQQQERELISGLFDRLQPFESQPRDPEAETLIKERAARQPGSPYLLVQTVLVQEQALKAAQERIAELEAKAAQASPPPSFLGSAPKIGPWGAAQAQSGPGGSVPSTVPSTRSPLQAALSPQQPMGMMGGGAGGGGFLRTALATAAGVAGGALLFEGIRNLMGSSPGAFGPALAQTPSSLLPPDTLPASDTSPADTFAQENTYDDNNLQSQNDQSDDYDTASLDQDQDFGGSDLGGGSDDDSWT
jgi:hypothetical protein